MELSWNKAMCTLMKATAKAFNAGSLKHRVRGFATARPIPSECANLLVTLLLAEQECG